MKSILTSLFLVYMAIFVAPQMASADDLLSGFSGPRLKILMLTYNWPEEHNVLQSLLCLQPCTKKNKCPKEVLKYQKHAEIPEVFWNDQFIVVRPVDIGAPQDVVHKFKGFYPNFISMSGHHSSGFSGERNAGDFQLESLNVYSSQETLASVFGSASLVMLNGCNTEVKSDFVGDPVEYIRHIIQDTQVRGGDLTRLRAAISQISGIQKSYRHIFPNACIMGYSGTSVPGGIPQIYGQYTNALRAIYKLTEKKELSPRLRLLTGGTYAENEKKVFNECPRKQWPCNLCKKDPQYYSSLYLRLAKFLRSEKIRQSENRSYTPTQVKELETLFNGNRFYKNSKWACSEVSPDTPPTLPNVDSLPRSGKLLIDLLLIQNSQNFTSQQLTEVRGEVLHQLAYIRFSDEELQELRTLIQQDDYKKKIMALRSLITNGSNDTAISDYFNISQKLLCTECLRGIDTPEGYTKASKREKIAFARSLEPSFGIDRYQLTINDSDDKIAAEAAKKIEA